MPSETGLDDALLSGVDHRQVQHLTRAFDIMADRLGVVSNSTALWSLAMLLAKILANTALHPEITDATGQRFSDMLRAAYPVMVRTLETVQREQDGRPEYDA